jgi:hypothetical protein
MGLLGVPFGGQALSQRHRRDRQGQAAGRAHALAVEKHAKAALGRADGYRLIEAAGQLNGRGESLGHVDP